jgi:pyrroline-5-carboxylate reductase
MQLGFIGAGNMASALARGFGEPVLACDPVGARAAALVADLGGEALATQAEVAEAADVVFLCHKPAQLAEVAAQTDDRAKAVVSILAGTPVARVEESYPGRPVYRFLPNIPAQVKKGVSCYVPGAKASEGPEPELLELFERVGIVVRLDEPLIEPAMALMSCGPAFFALTVEALVDAGVRHGLQAGDAEAMAVQTMAGAAALLQETGATPSELRRQVTSPGGTTAAGLAALEAGGLRASFMDAVSAVVEKARS